LPGARFDPQAHDKGSEVRASYLLEVAVSVRGCQWQMTRREVREHSAIFRSFDQLFPKAGAVRRRERAQSPQLFTVFLDPRKSVKASKSVSFAFDLKVLVPDYVVDGVLFMKRHYEGGFIYRELLIVEAFPDRSSVLGWRVKYGYQEINPGKPGSDAQLFQLPDGSGFTFEIPVAQKARPGLSGRLRIEARSWQ